MSRLPLLLAFLSGAAALGYELVWMRALSRAFGVSVHALSALLALYLGGLGVGAALGSRWKTPRAARAYAACEIAAGLLALAASAGLARLPELVSRLGGAGPVSMAARLLLAAPLVLPPTMLLGAALPLLARAWPKAARPDDPARAAGTLYAANTAGALAGVLAAAFWTIGTWGEGATVAACAALNLSAGTLGLLLPQAPAAAPRRDPRAAPRAERLYALSGFCALGAEVLWSRQLIPLLGNSSYAFALVLATVLAGSALGSAAGARMRDAGDEQAAFGHAQLALCACMLMSLLSLRSFGLALDSADFLYSPLRGPEDLGRLALCAVVLVGPAAFVMGLLFPIAVRLHARGSAESSAALGGLYAANTLGGIAGSLLAGLWAAQALGAHRSLLLLAALSAALGLWALRGARSLDWRAGAAALALALLGVSLRHDPSVEILMARLAKAGHSTPRLLFHDELAAATITGVDLQGAGALFVNGVDTAGTAVIGTAMAVIPHVLLKRPGPTLVICFGAGNTFRTTSRLAGPAAKVDAVELIDGLAERMPSFYPDAPSHLNAPGRRVFVEDGRQFLLRDGDEYSAIIVDAAPPLYSSGAVNLYTVEFLRLARRRLASDGLFLLWLPLPAFADDYWTILRGVDEVFPESAIWAHPALNGALVIASEKPLSWPKGELARRLARRGALGELPGLTEEKLRANLFPIDARVRAALARHRPLRDDLPETEFPLRRWLAGGRFESDLGFLRAGLKAQ